MRRVFARCLLVGVLLVPNAFASETTETSLWAEFSTWLEARIGVPNGMTVETAYTFWLMSRMSVPGG